MLLVQSMKVDMHAQEQTSLAHANDEHMHVTVVVQVQVST